MLPVSTPLPKRLAEGDSIADTLINSQEFYTPLQRVSSNNYTTWGPLNPNHKSNTSHKQVEPAKNIAPSNNANITSHLDPLPSIDFRKGLNFSRKSEDDAQNLSKLVPSQPLYYRPPVSSNNHFGVSHLIPPRIHKNFLVRQREAPISNSESDDINVASGDWTSSVVKEALRRQVNTEREVTRLGINILLIIAFKLVVKVGYYLVAVYQAEFLTTSSYYQRHNTSASVLHFNHLIKLVYVAFLINICIALYRLLRAQDQCIDLPLTNEQRRLCGLQPLTSKEDSTALKMKKRRFELTHEGATTQVPKYGQAHGTSIVQETPEEEPDRFARALMDHNGLRYLQRLQRNNLIEVQDKSDSNQTTDRRDALRKFNTKFNIDFL